MKKPTDKREAEVIDITEHIKKRKMQNAKKDEQPEITNSDLSDFIELMELHTDDIAGTLLARHVYSVDLLPGITTDSLLNELKIRIYHHTKLVEDLEGTIQ